MSKPKPNDDDDRASQFARRKRTLLPEKGQGSNEPETEFIMNSTSTLLEALYEMTMCVARPLCGLVRYVLVDAWVEPWKKEPPEDGSKKPKK